MNNPKGEIVIVIAGSKEVRKGCDSDACKEDNND